MCVRTCVRVLPFVRYIERHSHALKRVNVNLNGEFKASLTFKCMTEHLFADFSYSGYLFMKTNDANE